MQHTGLRRRVMSSENKWLIALKIFFILLALSAWATTLPVFVTLLREPTAYRLMQTIVYTLVSGLWTSLAIFVRPRQ